MLNKDIKNLKSGSKMELKKLINKYIRRITVFENKIEIEYIFTSVNDVLNMQWLDSPRPDIFKTYLNVLNYITKKGGIN